MDWTLCLERNIGTGGLLNVWIFDGRNGRLLVTLKDLRRSAETGIIAVLPGNP